MPTPLDALVLWAAADAPRLRAAELSHLLHIPCVATAPQQGPFLHLSGQRLEFRMAGDAELPGALWVDFDNDDARRRSRQGRTPLSAGSSTIANKPTMT